MKKTVRYIIILSLLTLIFTTLMIHTSAADINGGEIFFDDFNYTSPADPSFNNFNWKVRTFPGDPGVKGSRFEAGNISFIDDGSGSGNKLLQLSASTDGTVAGTSQAEISQTKEFYEGTYAFRVRFTNDPVSGPDGDKMVQNLVGIHWAPVDDLNYSECVFSYTGNGGWGQPSSAMSAGTFETLSNTGSPDMASTAVAGDYSGWHTMVIVVWGGEVKYSIDGILFATHNGEYYPENAMNMDLSLWFINEGRLLLNQPGEISQYNYQVDWAYYGKDTVMTTGEVEAAAQNLRSQSTSRLNTIKEVFFDDFNYSSANDPSLTGFNWAVRNWPGGPGPDGANWPGNVTFVDDGAGNKLLRLSASTDGTASGTDQAEIHQPTKFYEGTYAARIRFTDLPQNGGPSGDRIVEDFLAICSPSIDPGDLAYSSCDFDYTPNGAWGITGPTLWMNTWDYYLPDQFSANKGTTRVTNTSFVGWHTLMFTVADGVVKYYVDGNLKATHTGTYYPESLLSLRFRLWFADLQGRTPGGRSQYDEDVDWVYYGKDTVMDTAAVEAAVQKMRDQSVKRLDTVTMQETFFDDFNYTASGDPGLTQHQWFMRMGPGGPGPEGADWPGGVGFVDDGSGNKLLRLSAWTIGTGPTTRQAELQQSNRFFEGTYAARVRFMDSPVNNEPDGDQIVQDFFARSDNIPTENSAYSQCDFNYLPNGGWGETGSTLCLNTWESYVESPWSADMATDHVTNTSLNGWHTLVFVVWGGEVKYYVDGVLKATHGGKYYPESPMSIHFRLWFTEVMSGIHGPESQYLEDVDWVYYGKDRAMTTAAVEAQVQSFRNKTITYQDSLSPMVAMPTACTLTVVGDGHGTVTPEGNIQFNHFEGVTIQAAPSPRYQFVNWEKIDGTGNVIFTDGNAAQTTVSLNGGDATIRANFTPIIPETLTPGSWTTGNLTAPGQEKLYSFNAIPGHLYTVTWDDRYNGSGAYNGDIKVSANWQDSTTTYFSNIDSGYSYPQAVTARENTVNITVCGYSSGSTGSYAIKVSEVPSKPVINVKQGTANIVNGTGSYNFGNVQLGTSSNVSLMIENNGGVDLHLTGNPMVQISGTDASCFSVTSLPYSPVGFLEKASAAIRFTPTSPGVKTATVTIPNDDPDNSTYTFTISGTGTGTIQSLTPDTWTSGSIAAAGDIKCYSFATTPGKTYTIAWDDKDRVSSTYTCDVKVSAFRQDFYTPYFNDVDAGYSSPQIITPGENVVYIKVTGYSSYSTGSFALKVCEIIPTPQISLELNSTNLPNGGTYDFGNAAVSSYNKYVSITIWNRGTGSLEFTNTPRVKIEGPNAADFEAYQPYSPVGINGSTTFSIYFSPKSTGTRTATVIIANNTPDSNPYTFTITGTGVIEGTLPLDTWTQGSITTRGENKTYCLNVIPGNSYTIAWDELQGSGAYTGGVEVSAYRQDAIHSYFSYIDSGYTTPQTFIAQDNLVYIRVQSNPYDSTGSYALKASLQEPVINLKQGTTAIASGGNFDFGNLALCANRSVTFTIQNTGGNLTLTDTPRVRISGADASFFNVTTDASTPVAPGGSTTFTINFNSTDIGTKTATVSIACNSNNSPYTFTITGTGVMAGTLTDGVWTPGNIATVGEAQTYCFHTTPGTVYAIAWEGKYDGSRTYTGFVKVSAYRQDKTISYFNDITFGYTQPQVFTALDDMVYIKVDGANPSETGTYALKAFVSGPVMEVSEYNTGLIPNGGVYDYGNISLCSDGFITFTIKNNGGTMDLNLTGTPMIQISGPDAASFSTETVTQPSSPLRPNITTNFAIRFIPTSTGKKTATVTITNNDSYHNPYTFTLTGIGVVEPMPLSTWTQGALPGNGIEKTFCFNTVPGNSYTIAWDDRTEGSGTYTAKTRVSAYRADTKTSYFFYDDRGYLTPRTFTALDNIVYIKVEGDSYNTTGSFAVKASFLQPVMMVKQGTNAITNGTGSYTMGSVALCSSKMTTFTIQNYGSGAGILHLSNTPPVQISGADAACFIVKVQPDVNIPANISTTFEIQFTPNGAGIKTATVSIANNDPGKDPFTFSISGTGTLGTLTPESWFVGNISTQGEEKTYAVNVIPGNRYAVTWDDGYMGSGTYTCDIKLSAYRQDLTTAYFKDVDYGYSNYQIITAQESVLYLKAAGFSTSYTGTFALKIYVYEPIINVKQGTTNIPNGTGMYDFGNVALCSNKTITFTIQNNGTNMLNLTGTPAVQLSGADAAYFNVTVLPASSVVKNSSTTFTVQFTPVSTGSKTATVSIANNDADMNPYTFTITGNGTMAILTPEVWTTGNITAAGEEKTYAVSVTSGRTYAITWDDSSQGTGQYTGNVKVSAYRQDLTTTYFKDIDAGYSSFQVVSAQDSIVYLKVVGYNPSSTGSFALKAYLYEPVINVKQGTTDIPNGTGSYDFGISAVCSSKTITFTIQNSGIGPLNLPGTPKVQINGADAACFTVPTQPASPVAAGGSTAFTVAFAPTGAGMKTATVSITNNDSDMNPYTFTITGSGTMETLTGDVWTIGNITTAGEEKSYLFTVTPGKKYAIAWDDSYEGTGKYTANVKVSVYRQDLVTTYFSAINSGYSSPPIITAQESTLIIKVSGYYSTTTGSFALKAYLVEPQIEVKYGATTIPNGTGVYDFGNVALCSSRARTFTIKNNGNYYLNLTGNPYVKLGGADAACFNVSTQPAQSLISPASNTTFSITFTPTSVGTKTAIITVANDDTDLNPYTFTITATGTLETMELDTWTAGSITVSGDEKTYAVNVTPGKPYAIAWDDSSQGSGKYTANVSVSVYRQNMTTTYFSNADAGYSSPPVITPQESIVYIKVQPYFTTPTGSFGLKMYFVEPKMNVKFGTVDIPNGTGVYEFGNVALCSSRGRTFTIQNNGTYYLNLTGAPYVKLSGADAASFAVTSQPSQSTLGAGSSTNFTILFTPTSPGIKTATVSITNDDPDMTPYTFTITATGTLKTLEPETWTAGSINISGDEETYAVNVTPGKTYAIAWDDSKQGSGGYTCNVTVSVYRQNMTTTYFANSDSGFTSPPVIIPQESVIYIRVQPYFTTPMGTFALKVYYVEPQMNVKQGSINIPNGTGSFDFGNVALCSNKIINFTIQNNGSYYLNLTDNPLIRLSGTDAAFFSVVTQPTSSVSVGGSTTFSIKFTPTGAGTKTASVSILNNDPDMTPYIFTITGTGTLEIPISLDNWLTGTIVTPGEERTYPVSVSPGMTYGITWDDSYQGTGAYNGNIQVSAFQANLTSSYFSNIDSGYTTPRIFTALDNIVYIKVSGYGSSTGSFGLMPYLCRPKIGIKQGNTVIPNGAGIFDFGNVANTVIFTIQNSGTGSLGLPDSPKVRISGLDASSFSVTSQPSSPVSANSSTTFAVKFSPTSNGPKTATVSIVNSDENATPYTFAVTGTGVIETLSLDTWSPGSISVQGEEKIYCFSATPGTTYAIGWDDSYQGSGAYTGNIKVSAYRQDSATVYFTDIDSGYLSPPAIVAQESLVYVKVSGLSSTSTGSFALKASLMLPKITVKQGTTVIPNGTGSYDFGTLSSLNFTIQNSGAGPLNLTDIPKVRISGTDASCFSVTSQPSSPVAANSSTTFTVKFSPGSLGLKTATISIITNDGNANPYTFTVTGTSTADELTPGTWTTGNITTAGMEKLYWFKTTPGKSYSIAWNDSFQGSGTYSCDVKVSAYQQDLITTYFSNIDSGYNTPQVITAQENMVYVKVSGFSGSSTGSYAVKVTANEPMITVKQGSTNIANGTGSYSFGSIPSVSNSSVTFTIQNIGSGNLNLTDNPKVRISGTDAACFNVTANPSSPVAPNGSTTFTVAFTPGGVGTKSAVISILSDDPNISTFSFTVTGSGTTVTAEVLTLGTWAPGNISVANEVKTYCFSATPGKLYTIYWDDSYQGSRTYSLDIKVSGYRTDLTTMYFNMVDSGYSSPQTVTALDSTVYIKVYSYYTGGTGSYALKVVQAN